MTAGDRVFVVHGPWEGYAGVVVGEERTVHRGEMFVRVRLDNGSETLSPPSWFKKAKGSSTKAGVDDA